MSLLRHPGHLLAASLLHLLLGFGVIQYAGLTPPPAPLSNQPTAILIHLQPAPEPTLAEDRTPAPKIRPERTRPVHKASTPKHQHRPVAKTSRITKQRQTLPTDNSDAPHHAEHTDNASDANQALQKDQTPGISPSSNATLSAHRQLRTAYLQQLHHLLKRHQHYPRLARQRGEQGTVVVSFDIQPDSRLHNIQLHHATASERLNQAALRSVHKLNGLLPPLPAALNKRPWPVTVPIVYQLH
ncbi:MAG: TonB family protein [Pseudomonadota bacterium]